LAAFGVAYRRLPINLFGAVPIRSSTLALIFLGIHFVTLISDDQLIALAGAIVGAGAGAWMAFGGGGFGPLRALIDRARLWRIRRRYKVMQGGKGKQQQYWN
jgi:hypothetical protein